MSTLLIEVSKVDTITQHPMADRLEIATVKGWNTCVRKGEFKAGDLCIFFPPDSVLPAELANGPDDPIPGRLNVAKYLTPLPKDENGNRPNGGRLKATRLRGQQSYGLIMKIDPSKGDDPNWKVGDNVQEHFGITKWEPPVESNEGDAEVPHSFFYKYTDIEHFGNYPDIIPDGEEVVFTEKIHGKNTRLGLVLNQDATGNALWQFMCGSHDVNRKEFYSKNKRFEFGSLVEKLLIKADAKVNVGDILNYEGKKYKVKETKEQEVEEKIFENYKFIGKQLVKKFFIYTDLVDDNGEIKMFRSEFWEVLSENVKSLLTYIKDSLVWPDPKFSIILYGEIFGSGVQSMAYGFENGNRSFRAFDIAINNKYIDFDVKKDLLKQFNVDMVPILYRGPFTKELLKEYTDGPTTLCTPEKAGFFKGREGLVVVPVKETMSLPMTLTSTHGRVILKSISADYLNEDISDGH